MTACQGLNKPNPSLCVVYFDQCLGAVLSKRWSKNAFLTFLLFNTKNELSSSSSSMTFFLQWGLGKVRYEKVKKVERGGIKKREFFIVTF